MAWKGDSRRHGLARKGIKTRIDKSKRFDVSKYVSEGKDEDEKSDFYKTGYEEGVFSADVNLGDAYDEMMEAYENDEVGEIAGQVREIQVQYAGDISYDVKIFEHEIDIIDWIKELEEQGKKQPTPTEINKKFGIDKGHAEALLYHYNHGAITTEDYEEWDEGFYQGFYDTIEKAYKERKKASGRSKFTMVRDLMRKEGIEDDRASPNFVKDFADNRGIKLSSDEVVDISNRYTYKASGIYSISVSQDTGKGYFNEKRLKSIVERHGGKIPSQTKFRRTRNVHGQPTLDVFISATPDVKEAIGKDIAKYRNVSDLWIEKEK